MKVDAFPLFIGFFIDLYFGDGETLAQLGAK
jgi:hypothetical protein